MTPTLLGRLQTRLFVVLVVGGLWTLIVTPFLPVEGGLVLSSGGVTIRDAYELTFAALLVVAVFGCLFWEPLYQLSMQFRWEKDWPALFQLLQIVPEAISTWLLLHVDALNPLSDETGAPTVPGPAFLVLFVSTWIITWLFANGPMKIFFLRWRFSGGRLI
jgi:hypothetical protein